MGFTPAREAKGRPRQQGIAIVILTAHPGEMALRGCIRAGASGCLFKDVSEQNLRASLMQFVHGRTSSIHG